MTAILLGLVGSILVAFLTTQTKVEATLLRERAGSAIIDVFVSALSFLVVNSIFTWMVRWAE